jgi:cytochrome c-type biogenesis protein
MSELLLAFNLGLLNMANPCVLPLYPGFLAYLAGNRGVLEQRRTARWLGVLTLTGVLTSMLVIGLLLALFQVALGRALGVLLPLIYGVVIVMGVLLLLHLNPFARMPALRSPRLGHPALSAYLYGLLYGPMTLPCSGPLVIGVFAASADTASAFNGVLFTLMFGLGFGLPLVLLPLLAEPARARIIRWMAHHHVLMMRIAGGLLIAVGIFGFINDWELIRDNLTLLGG